MKMMICIVILFTSIILPQQVDTTDFFPMQTGNYWEYAASTLNGPVYFGTTVIGDTLMPNGKTYKILEEKYINITGQRFTWYFRKDTNKVYFAYPYAGCTNQESIYLDFSLPDSTVWEVCGGGLLEMQEE